MKNNYSLSEKIALKISSLSKEDINNKIRNIVYEKAIETGFISKYDRLNNTKKYKNFDEELTNYIEGLSFLSLVVYEKYAPNDFDSVMKFINDKVDATIKGMANNRINLK